MKHAFKAKGDVRITREVEIKREIERTNARLRHFRGVAASVMSEAFRIWQQICDACQDSRTCDEILEGMNEPSDPIPSCGWPEFRQKLHLLGHYIDYTRRLCEGSIEKTSKDESEVQDA